MPRIAVFGGTGYLASIIKNQNNIKKNSYTFFSRKKNNKNYINLLSSKKNLNILKNYDFIIHLAGPNQNQLKKNEKLIQKKNQITSKICDLCLANNIKLIYLSSMQVYKDYGINDIFINSKINLKNSYSKLHYDSEKIIIAKFLNHKKKFTILRMGNVFGFNRYNSIRDIDSNLIHSFCYNALKKKNILINNGSIRRTFIPSQIFLNVISLIIKRNLFNNLIENISYKNLNLKEIAYIIQKRLKLLFKFDVQVKIENFEYKKKYKIYSNKYLKFNFSNKMIYFEIDQILKCIKKNN
jgi:nucleoside-diphosphate-sugar epimerase